MCTLGDAADVNPVPATRVATRVADLFSSCRSIKIRTDPGEGARYLVCRMIDLVQPVGSEDIECGF